MAKYCGGCGQEKIKVAVKMPRYSEKTGKRVFKQEWVCPKSDTAQGFLKSWLSSVMHPFTFHDGDYSEGY